MSIPATLRTLAVMVVLALAVAACGGKGHGDVQSKVSAANTPQNQAATQAAQQQVARCLPKGNLLTNTGRQAIVDCVAPPAQQQALKACVLKAAATEHLATQAGRQRWREVDLPNCLVQVQKGAAK